MINERTWERWGSEAESADHVRRKEPVADGELEGHLAYHFDTDLAALSEEDRSLALAALVRGYRSGA